MAVLLHGTTRQRAERIAVLGPDPDFVEPGSSGRAEGFSTYLEQGPFLFGAVEDYARGKSTQFPQEGGPAILVLDVPDDVIALAVDECFPLSQGLIQFDKGAGLEELIEAWPNCKVEIRVVSGP